MSNFQKVIEFNKTFGLVHNSLPQPGIFDQLPDTVKLRLDLILEEVHELTEAVTNKNMVETVDALADILYVVYGAGSAFGVNLDRAFDIVHRSNMSKLCKTEDEAIETVRWYSVNEPRYDSPTYRKSTDSEYWIVYNRSTGKILKSIQYCPADLHEIVTDQSDPHQTLITDFLNKSTN